jgi:hypothetical protein
MCSYKVSVRVECSVIGCTNHLLQQFPHFEPSQVKPPVAPFEKPQRALVETFSDDGGEAEAAAEDERVTVWRVEAAALDED